MYSALFCTCLTAALGLQLSSVSPKFDAFLKALDSSSELSVQFDSMPGKCWYYLPLTSSSSSVSPTILGDLDTGSRLFVRPCYPLLWQKISAEIEKHQSNVPFHNGVLISGNDGVGKSFFLAYILKQLRSRANRSTIVFHNITARYCHVIRPDATEVESYREVEPSMVEDEETFYLVDIGGPVTHGPLNCHAFTIVVASPQSSKKENTVKAWQKHGGYPKHMYMPCWEEQELQACRRIICPTDEEHKARPDMFLGARRLLGVSADDLADRFNRFGGIARISFLPQEKLPQLVQELETAIHMCDLEQVVRAVGTDLPLICNVTTWVLHYGVNEEFRVNMIDFASPTISKRIWRLYGDNAKNVARQFIDAASGNAMFSGAKRVFRGPG